MALKQSLRTVVVLMGLSITGMKSAMAANVGLALGDSGLVTGTSGSGGYRVTLDDAAVVWHFSNGEPDPVLTPVPVGTRPGGLVAAFNVASATVEPLGSAQVLSQDTSVQIRSNYDTRVTVRGGVTATMSVESAVLQRESGAIKEVLAQGGIVSNASAIPGTLGGGQVAFSSLRVDHVAQAVYGTMTGGYQGEEGWVSMPSLENAELFRYRSLTGVRGLSEEMVHAAWAGDGTALAAQGWAVQSSGRHALGLTGWSQLDGLQASSQAFDYLVAALDVAKFGTAYNVLYQLNDTASGWGTLRVGLGIRVTDTTLNDGPGAPWHDTLPPVRLVPEPGTYALMGLGLVGVAVVRARRQA